MPTKATPVDAELILKLYDLRREPEMRKARTWWMSAFWPESAEDFFKIGMASGTPENNWLRQVTGYWEMAASLVNHGALNEDLFMELSVCGEMFFLFGKTRPFLKELREKFQAPAMLANVEQLITKTKKRRDTLKVFEERIAARRKATKEEKAKKEAAA